MRILPKDPSIHKITTDLILDNCINPFNKQQIRLNNYLINIHLGVSECILFDNDENIVDGFVTKFGGFWLYKGKTFFELLGSVEGIANPLHKSLYENSVEIEQTHPDLIIWNN